MNEVDAWRERLRSFDSLASYSIEVAALTTDRTTDVLDSAVVSPAFFSTSFVPAFFAVRWSECTSGRVAQSFAGSVLRIQKRACPRAF